MMTTQPNGSLAVPAADDFTYDLQVNASPRQVLDAVTDGDTICRWWTAATRAEQQGPEVRLFTDDGPFVFFTLEHAPGSTAVAWTVTTCVLEDWVGTRPSFSVRPTDDGGAALQFRHIGLRPALECFDQCRAGWGHFMPSLAQFLDTGEGRPNQPRDVSA
jgi:uncharacterized protein YndB with AHSA1/START domain